MARCLESMVHGFIFLLVAVYPSASLIGPVHTVGQPSLAVVPLSRTATFVSVDVCSASTSIIAPLAYLNRYLGLTRPPTTTFGNDDGRMFLVADPQRPDEGYAVFGTGTTMAGGTRWRPHHAYAATIHQYQRGSVIHICSRGPADPYDGRSVSLRSSALHLEATIDVQTLAARASITVDGYRWHIAGRAGTFGPGEPLRTTNGQAPQRVIADLNASIR